MVEIFGGIFALLLVLFLLMNCFRRRRWWNAWRPRPRRASTGSAGGSSGEGYVVLAFPSELRIVETGQAISAGAVCRPDSPFVPYVRRVYQADRQQIVFAILEDGVGTMAEARNCIMRVLPERLLSIGWIIANDELLKSVSLGDIPAFIRQAVAPDTPETLR